MNAFRIRHIPSGLFYKPCYDARITGKRPDGEKWGTFYCCKSNLSKKGKIYAAKPTIKHVGSRIYNHLVVFAKFQEWLNTNPPRTYSGERHGGNRCVEVADSDWQIETLSNNEWIPVS